MHTIAWLAREQVYLDLKKNSIKTQNQLNFFLLVYGNEMNYLKIKRATIMVEIFNWQTDLNSIGRKKKRNFLFYYDVPCRCSSFVFDFVI